MPRFADTSVLGMKKLDVGMPELVVLDSYGLFVGRAVLLHVVCSSSSRELSCGGISSPVPSTETFGGNERWILVTVWFCKAIQPLCLCFPQ